MNLARLAPTLTWPVAAPLQRCAELLGVELAAVYQAAAHVEPYLRVDGSKVWSLMHLERRLHRPAPVGRWGRIWLMPARQPVSLP